MNKTWRRAAVAAAAALWAFCGGLSGVAKADDAKGKEVCFTDPAVNKQGGTPAASSQPVDAETCDHAFEQGTQAKWLGNWEDAGAWVQYTFKGEGYVVKRYRIISANDAPERDPKHWKVLGSNDDGKTWTTLDERKDQSFADRFTANLYPIANPALFKTYRLQIIENNGSTEDNQGGKGLVQLSEWNLLSGGDAAPAAGAPATPAAPAAAPGAPAAPAAGAEVIVTKADYNKQGGTPSASSQPVDAETCDHAFEQGTQQKWLGNMDDGGAWLQYAFNGDGYAVSKYRIISANDAPERDPKDWKVLGSQDGKTWVTLDERKDQSFADRFTANVYTIKTPAVYKMYRLAISANNGSTEDQTGGKGITQLSEWNLIK